MRDRSASHPGAIAMVSLSGPSIYLPIPYSLKSGGDLIPSQAPVEDRVQDILLQSATTGTIYTLECFLNGRDPQPKLIRLACMCLE